ncbi:MAG: hypothetical protein R3B96_04920 [Pirellulaceae bacterium]
MRNGSPNLQQFAVDLWLEREDTRSTLIRWLEDPEHPVRQVMTRQQQSRLLETVPAETAERLRARWAIPAMPDEADLLARYLEASSRDPDLAQALAYSINTCANCHQADAQGKRLGPDLNALRHPVPNR